MPKLLIVGAGGFGRMAAEAAAKEYDCAFVDDGQRPGTVLCGVPVVGSVADLPRLREDYDCLAVAVGSNAFRKRVYAQARALGYRCPNLIAPSAYVSPYARMGWGCVVMQNACIQNGAAVGSGVILNAGTEIHCGASVGDFALLYTNSVVRTGGTVGTLARVGSCCVICGGASVPEGADIPDCTAVRPETSASGEKALPV